MCRQNFDFKFQAIAEKTAKNLSGTLFCRTLYNATNYQHKLKHLAFLAFSPFRVYV